MNEWFFNHFQSIMTIASGIIGCIGAIIATPNMKRFFNSFKSKIELNDAYYHLLEEFKQDRESWKETMVSWKNTATALRSEMIVLKERLSRIETELEKLISKYKEALHFIHELKSHIVPKDMPMTPLVLENDLEQINQEKNKGNILL